MIPKKFFKYERINSYTLRNLKNAQIYFNHFSAFNDPFDCPYKEAIIKVNDKDTINFYNKYLKDVSNTNIIAKSLNDIPKEFKEQSIVLMKMNYKEMVEKFFPNLGIVCFSTKNDDILMWSHYTDGHKGICLEFDSQPFDKAFQVKYSNDYPVVNPYKLVFNDKLNEINSHKLNRDFLKPLLTKYKCWSYEEEWRIFHQESYKNYSYKPESLKAIYFGIKTEKTDMKIISLIAYNQNKNIKFFKAKKNPSIYKIDFEEIVTSNR